MIQTPLQGKPYEAYVPADTRLDIIYVRDAVEALLGLYAAKPDSLFNVDEKTGTKTPRRVYNIAGIRMNGQAPQASDIAAAVMKKVGKEGIITYNPNPVLTTTVKTFGILDDSAARKNWQWKGA